MRQGNSIEGAEFNTVPEQSQPAQLGPPPIGSDQIREAWHTYRKYKEGRANYEKRIIENNDYWRLNHWRNFESRNLNPQDPRPKSAWLFNSINNKHADFMDNFPSANVLAREESDAGAAETLSAVVPVILENCDFEQVYSDNSTEKLKNGSAVYAVYFNARKNHGLGDIDVRTIDILSFFWEPGIQDLQDSRNIFVVTLVDNDLLEAEFPQLSGKLSGSRIIDRSTYNYDDNIDTSKKSLVVDWYYKVRRGTRDILHYVKFVGEEVLFASENLPEYENGFYEHGKYPFVLDVLFPEKDMPVGFGYIDIMRSPQEHIDKLGQAILKNSQWCSRPRYFVSEQANINLEEFGNLERDFVSVAGRVDESLVRPIETPQLNGNYLAVLQMKIDELKETSGNRDFSQGSTTAGVTAASAIAALQEAGSKTSRDMIKASYRSFSQICYMVIELVRQFYDEPRVFRITGTDGGTEYVQFTNAGLKQGPPENNFGLELQGRLPVFDIKIRAQKSSPYAREAQNELALQLYQRGFFNPDMAEQALICLDMMEFEGKDKLRERIDENARMAEQLAAMQEQMLQMADLIAQSTGDARISEALRTQAAAAGMEPPPAMGGMLPPEGVPEVDLSGDRAEPSIVEKARARAGSVNEVR